MYCLLSLPRAGSIATYSWMVESLGIAYPQYKEVSDLISQEATHPRLIQKIAETFEEIDTSKKIYAGVKKTYNDLEQTLMPYNYYYDLRLYETLTKLKPLPVVSLKVGKNYAIMDKFISNSDYKCIVLTRKDVKKQFLSFIVSTQTQTYHGNREAIFEKRKRFEKIEIHPAMFSRWFDWSLKLHRLKSITNHVFYLEDIEKNPNFFLNSLGLPSIEIHDKVIQKTKDTDFMKYIKNPDVFEKTWNEYYGIYRGII
jgi:hypothetical protein